MKNTKKKRDTAGTIMLVFVLIAGLVLLLYPTFSDWWNSFHQSRAIASYVRTTASMDEKEYEKMLQEAEAYNAALLSKPNRFVMTEEEEKEYASILDVTGTGIMGYVEIPSIGVSLPVYHGIEESVLQVAIGHIAGTSLPVGGTGTHCAISGHRGLPSAKLFTDIDQLSNGDTFLLQILGRTLTYEVDQIRTVLPQEMDDLKIDPEGDYCTLITCTPYGINTHRLLVRGKRIPNLSRDVNVIADAIRIDPIIAASAAAAPFLLLLIIVVSVRKSRKKK